MHDPLREPHEEQLVVDRTRARGLLRLAMRIVQEHQIEIGRIAELDTAELAVTDRTDAHRSALAALTAHRGSELRSDLSPAELDRTLHDELGDVREPVADTHQRQPAGEIRDGHPKDGGTLELAQRLDLVLGVVIMKLLHTQLELRGEARAIGQFRQQPLVNQLIEKQRMRCDLLRKEITVAAKLDQTRARRGVLVQEREIRGALPDRFDDVEDPAQYGELRAARRDGRSVCSRLRPRSSSLRTSADERS